MNKLRILRGFCLGPVVGDVYPGDVIDAALIPARTLRPYILAGKLEPIVAEDHVHDESAPAKRGGKKHAIS
ncbi:MAG TPA: hypothetical protein VLH56_02495 [Dissulfurispiraceae bacterium]|nr:hypothetical protein [Dissulfurispiraceae bacterium]